ncbi:GPI mannosyltransferase 2 [Termitomyces sp. J132]|nr:GPI mannosyltransferase 2 [Termitomyces sp. J132]
MIAPRPLFDASPRLQLPSSPYVRWDAIHFLAIADAGNKYENPSIVLLVVAADSARILHRLTCLHFPASPAFARLVLLLSLFPSSPATLYLAPYAEPFFTYLSYRGMFHAAQHHWIRATLCFVLATFFRSNGVLLAVCLVWGLVFQPFLDRKQVRTRLTEPFPKMAYSIVLSACVAAPFIYHNYKAYRLFCDWCYRIPPYVYTHVQAKYWDVGFLRHCTPPQIPNFVIAAPPLVLLIAFSVQHIKSSFLGFRARFNGVKETDKEENLFAMPSITPYLVHSLAMCITLIFFSHTQIVLRLAAALPALYWAVGWLFVRRSPWAKIWIWWSVLWGLISLGLWTAFLPPA